MTLVDFGRRADIPRTTISTVSEPSETAVKTLFAHSRNKCFFEICEDDLTKEGWKQVNGEVAHIKVEKPTSARYDADQPDKERQDFDNLMLLCPKHHKLVDRLEPYEYTVERLSQMRQNHLGHSAAKDWCTDEKALEFARLAIDYWRGDAAPGLHILNARYGADATFVDVTALLSSLVQNDELRLVADNATMGGDPLENVVKSLEVQYQVDGTSGRKVIQEGDTLNLR